MKIHLCIIVLGLSLCSGIAASSAEFDGWKHSGSIYILTTPEGANLPEASSVQDFPLLVQLHKDFFDFREVKANGEDLRFSTSSGAPLAYQIEEWNTARGVAGIWVRIPIIKGNSRQEIKLHWGKADAASESNGKAVFNATNGYLSVWHMSEPVQDSVGTLTSVDTGTTAAVGMIGSARRFPGGKGVFCGDKIPNYPAGAASHSSEAWFRAEKPNATLFGWGNEGGGRGSKVRMQLRSPPHIRVDSDFADVKGESRLPLAEWVHVVHTYDREDGRIYINGRLDGSAKPLLGIKSPARLWLGGWYHNYDFVGEIDEVRISQVARSADWIHLQYENQKPLQTLVGPLVQPGSEFSVSESEATVPEGQSKTFTAKAGGAQKIYWVLKHEERGFVVATDRLAYTFQPGRVDGDNTAMTLQFKAVYAKGVVTKDIPLTIKDVIPDPVFSLAAPANWDGRQVIEIVPQVTNLNEMQTQGAGKLNYTWTVSGLAVSKEIVPGKLLLKRAQNSGPLTVSVAIDNGGAATVRSATIQVKEPAKDEWVVRTPAKDEKPVERQFYARDDKNEGTLYYNGTLADAADSVFLKLYADEKLVGTVSQKPLDDKSYTLSIKLKPGLIKYKVEFGSKTKDTQTLLHTVSNLVCGDAFLINGQSNADATDVGKEDPTFTSEWIRSYGSPAGSPAGARLQLWGNAVVRDRSGGKAQVGYWGLELARQLVVKQKVPICIINGAVGGSRIDQHQRNAADPTDVTTIYGRLLWRVQQARLTHGIRGVLWHQGENDQGADGPAGGFGWETYQQFFIDMAGAWKEDYPNLQHYYMFQIWPKACAMGVNGSDNKLREVQRMLPAQFSRLSIMSTLGIKPPGGCHFPIEGYAQFARLLGPLVERDHYGVKFSQPVGAPNLLRAAFASGKQNELTLEFDQNMVWAESLTRHFYLDGVAKQVESGAVAGKVVTLKLKEPSKASRVTYLDSQAWSPDNLLYGENGIAALTFCEVPIRTRAERGSATDSQ